MKSFDNMPMTARKIRLAQTRPASALMKGGVGMAVTQVLGAEAREARSGPFKKSPAGAGKYTDSGSIHCAVTCGRCWPRGPRRS
jgi:hypothetical protein